jgi:replicative DNA helicase
LAGLIDTDGHYLIQSNGYEITQKNKRLAENIKFLCDTLGFRTSFNAKRATIKSIGYESEVYRVRIYGDINRIPVRLKRKEASPWKSPVDWQVTGIKIEDDGIGDYYGFEIDGNRRFLLEDMTVTHNTAFTLSLARNAAVDFGKPVAMFSLEMSNIQFVQRLIASEAQISGSKLRTGKLEDHEWKNLHNAVEKLSEIPIFIDDTPGINIFELRAKCRRLKTQHDIQMIIIDYLQLMTGGPEGGKNNGNREQEISAISRALKGLAKELSVPVIALSQLSRAVETRGGSKRPQLSDLRECVTGDTRIALADGSWRTIADCVGEHLDVLTLDQETLKITTQQTDLIWEVGTKPVYEIQLTSGRRIKASAEHRLLSFEGWKMMSNIEEGTLLGVYDINYKNPKSQNVKNTVFKTQSVNGFENDELELLESPSLENLANSDIFWDTVKKIEYVGEEPVYDVSVPEHACWIANDIFSHNSGAIEQDADIVSFIYRPEYYQILEDEEGNSLKGIAEIIIAKHRNGALETVKLRFIDQFAKFDNLGDPNFDDLPNNAFGDSNNTDQGNTVIMGSRMNNGQELEQPPQPMPRPKDIDTSDIPF